MSRRLFGTWGVNLDDDAFAQALAALGIVEGTHFPFSPETNTYQRVESLLRSATVPVRFSAFVLPAEAQNLWMQAELEPAEIYMQAWQQGMTPGSGNVRLEIHTLVPKVEVPEFPALDPLWLVEQLSRPAVGASSVFVREGVEGTPIGWNWPLTVGFLPDEGSRQFRDAIRQSPYSHLFQAIDLAVTARECDLLVLPYNLRTALHAVLGFPTTLHADCVLVLGSFESELSRAYTMIDTLRAEVHTAGVGVMRIPNGRRADWFTGMIVQLSHNHPLDVALSAASRNLTGPATPLASPYLAASRDLVDLAQLEIYALRLAAYLSDSKTTYGITLSPNTAVELQLPQATDLIRLGEELSQKTYEYQWQHETGNATSFVNLRSELETQLGTTIRLPRAVRNKPLIELGSHPVGSLPGYDPRLNPILFNLPESGGALQNINTAEDDAQGSRSGETAGELAGEEAAEVEEAAETFQTEETAGESKAREVQGAESEEREETIPEGQEETKAGSWRDDDFYRVDRTREDREYESERRADSERARQQDKYRGKFPFSPRRRMQLPYQEESAEPEKRRLQARFVQRDKQKTETAATQALQPETAYIVQVRIAAPDKLWAMLQEGVFPSHLLPPRPEGNKLTVVLMELASGGRQLAPQTALLFLPARADSDACEFYTYTGAGPYTWKGRIVVLYQNYVLETGILEAAVLAKNQAVPQTNAIALRRETVVAPLSAPVDHLQPFDAALVVNHGDDGVPGATAIAGRSVSFLSPVGLQESVEGIGKAIGTLTRLPDQKFNLNDAELVQLLRQLANYGFLTWDMLSQDMGDLLAHARRIQVVEAREGALLPVEFFYEGKSPLNSATLCGHALAALAAALSGEACPNLADAKFTCPTDFWGFNRVIERRPHMKLDYGNEFQLSEPSSQRSRLDILSNAVLGVNDRVRQEDVDGIAAELRNVTDKDVPVVKTWDELAKQVQANSPSLLVLLPHSLPDPQTMKMPALEIGHDILNSSQLDAIHVCGPLRFKNNVDAKPGPAVLLLGCSTDFAQYPFQNFVARFARCGASLVLGTLSPIRGRHTVSFVRELLKELKHPQQPGERTFGEALLLVKRHLLANGDPFALALTAYGNAGWLV